MAIRTLTVSSPPTRTSLWTMLNEAWGHFTGGIVVADWAASNARIRESQIRFTVSGHDHTGAGTGAGAVLSTTALNKRLFNLNDCRVAWGDLWRDRIFDTFPYAMLGGSGWIPLDQAYTTGSIIYGTRAIDFNPFATAPPSTLCQLDVRVRSIYDTGAGNFNTNWQLVGAVAFVVGATSNPQRNVFCIDWISHASTPYLWAAAYNHATTGSSVSVDYLAVVKRL